jgi:hypothetical protein
MGPIVDRSREFLTSSDLAIIQVRRTLLNAVRDYQEGKAPPGTDPGTRLDQVQSRSAIVETGRDWREVV